MTSETITLRVQNACGYAGKTSSHRAYIAEITGTSDAYIFARSFCETTAEDRAEMFCARRKGRGTWWEAAALPFGLYEVQDSDGERRYRLVRRTADGRMVSLKLDVERATAIALLLDDGKALEEARAATKPPESAKPASDTPEVLS